MNLLQPFLRPPSVRVAENFRESPMEVKRILKESERGNIERGNKILETERRGGRKTKRERESEDEERNKETTSRVLYNPSHLALSKNLNNLSDSTQEF